MFEKRLIIGGLARAGTTLFRSMLDASGSIISGPETGFFLQPLSVQQERASRVAARINRALDLGEQTIKDAVLQSRSSVACFDRLMERYCEQTGVRKSGWAEKTPRNCLSYAWLARTDPDIRFISLIRDGRDVVTSVLDEERGYHVSLQRYVETMDFVYAFESPRHMVVRYEDLVQDPEACMRQVFGFLNLPFESHVCHAYTEPAPTRSPEKVLESNAIKSVSTTSIGKWRRSEHAERLAEFLADERCRYWLRRSGYGEDVAS